MTRQRAQLRHKTASVHTLAVPRRPFSAIITTTHPQVLACTSWRSPHSCRPRLISVGWKRESGIDVHRGISCFVVYVRLFSVVARSLARSTTLRAWTCGHNKPNRSENNVNATTVPLTATPHPPAGARKFPAAAALHTTPTPHGK